MNIINWLEKWSNTYCKINSCNKIPRIKIGTLDNPGWHIFINLNETDLEKIIFELIEIDNSYDDWIDCFVEDNILKCASDPNKLNQVIKIFKDWSDNVSKQTTPDIIDFTVNSFDWLMEWYKSYCDGDWEHSFGVAISTLNNHCWDVSINLQETDLEDIAFDKIQIYNNKDDFIECFVENNFFKGNGDLLKLDCIIKVFRDWVENVTIKQ